MAVTQSTTDSDFITTTRTTTCTSSCNLGTRQEMVEMPAPTKQTKREEPLPQPTQERPQETMNEMRVGYKFETSAYNYKLEEIIGDGGYGRVFEAMAISKTEAKDVKQTALKIEPKTTSTGVESSVLQAALNRQCRRIPKVFEYGTIGKVSFISMECKGRDLYQLRKERRDGKFTLGTAVRTAIMALNALKELHEIGYISRDVKPGNFVAGRINNNGDVRNVYMVDFGLCRRYKDAVIPSRGEVGWRGTNRYGSLQAHRRQDLSRKDDMESWFYMLVELTKGALPWATQRDRNEIYKRKQAAQNDVQNFLSGCPTEFEDLLHTIDDLQFGDEPNYAEMTRTLEKILDVRQIERNGPMDWESDKEENSGQKDGFTNSIQTPTTQKNKWV